MGLMLYEMVMPSLLWDTEGLGRANEVLVIEWPQKNGGVRLSDVQYEDSALCELINKMLRNEYGRSAMCVRASLGDAESRAVPWAALRGAALIWCDEGG